MYEGRMMVFAGNAHPQLARDIAHHLQLPLGQVVVGRFSDGEVMVELMENVRGRDVFIVQPTCAPTNDNIMELLVMADALRRSSAVRVTAVVPYFGYSRQDRRPRSARVPISAKVVANMITSVGVDRVLTVDLHADQIQGFFDKRRPAPNQAKVMHVIGDVQDQHCIVVDDMVDTAGTLCLAAQALKDRGAASVRAYCTHAVLSGPAVDNLRGSALDELVVTNTIPLSPAAAACPNIRQVSVAGLLAETMRRIHLEESVSSLFL